MPVLWIIVSVVRCGVLAAWCNAFFAGRVSLDQVVDQVTGGDAPHEVTGLPDQTVDPAPLRELLIAWRRTNEPVRAVFPVPGDVRGLCGPAGFRRAALDAGQATVSAGLGAVPEVVDFAPSSAPTRVGWRVWALEPMVVDYVSPSDAQFELTAAIREAATALAAADVANVRADPGDALHDARHAGEHLNLPPGHPARAVAVLAQAERMRAVLDLALADPLGGAVDRMGICARDSALRPLAAAVRRARVAGYNAY